MFEYKNRGKNFHRIFPLLFPLTVLDILLKFDPTLVDIAISTLMPLRSLRTFLRVLWASDPAGLVISAALGFRLLFTLPLLTPLLGE